MTPSHEAGCRSVGNRRGGGSDPSVPAVPVEAAGSDSVDGGFGVAATESDIGVTRGRTLETLLPNGIRVLTERIPGVRSVSVGIWVRQGSAHESEEVTGASHLLEHLVFKGTRRRQPREIAMALERLGGSLDAFTSREHTSYQARVLSEHLPEALDVLADLILDPLLRSEDLELEREVVLEEIATVEDTPDDQVFELHGEALWGDHPYGRSILGTRESVSGMEAEQLRSLHRERYRTGDLIVAAAGHLEHEEIVAVVRDRFGDLPQAPSRPDAIPAPDLDTKGRDILVPRETSQTHIVFGTRTPPRSGPDRYPLILLGAAFGGGMSSRLFQKVREELALAYSIYAFQSFYSRGGVSGVYVGTRPGWGDRVVAAIREEFDRMAEGGLPEKELRTVKDQVKGQLMLSLESTSSRLYRLAGFALYDQPHRSLDELLERIEGVSVEEVAKVAERWFDPGKQVVLRLGPEEGTIQEGSSGG